MARFEYEQCPKRGKWVYKFDHTPLTDGSWHRLNAETQALYRFTGDFLQFVDPVDLSEQELASVLAALVAHGPLATQDELEVVLETSDDGWALTSRSGGPVRFRALSELDGAYKNLRDLEAQGR